MWHLLKSQKNQVKYFQELEDATIQLLLKYHKLSLIVEIFNTLVFTLISKLDAKFITPVELEAADIHFYALMEQFSLKSTSSVTGGSMLPVPILLITFY